mmetsp:Transcript_54082/g.136630  ORF Transcript_54082/g.136630 Transcript_54082/m.136630 type:complete len:205 (-) Transcript_54082:838-1452(-)
MKHLGKWPLNTSIGWSTSWGLGMRSGPAKKQKQHKGMASSMSGRSCLRAQLSPKHSRKPAKVVFSAVNGPLIGRKKLLIWHHAVIFFRSDAQMRSMSWDGAWRKARINSQDARIAVRMRRQSWMWVEALDGLVNGTLTASQMGARILSFASSSSSMTQAPHGRGRIRRLKASGAVGMYEAKHGSRLTRIRQNHLGCMLGSVERD